MRRVEYPGRSNTNFCPDGVTGMSIAHASQTPKAITTSDRNVKKRRKLDSSLDDVGRRVVGR